jgi:23S rRNA (cytidine1920-2'-O)/16S rRNA (cytidine1409-2'-O)-methyltransferase
MKKERLDVLVHSRGLCESRERAKAEIMSGNVYIDGQKADKPGMLYPENANIELRGPALSFVSRGGLKLEKALKEFNVSPEGKTCIDCGASTGGFTDCLLKGGAKKVYAVDVGYGQLAWSLRTDPRVVSMERTNARHLTPEIIPEELDLAVIDVSFISLKLVLPAIKTLLKANGEVLCLIKPQFEAGKDKVGKKGVVRSPQVHREVLDNFINNASGLGFNVLNISWSPVRGPEGNIEYLGHLSLSGEQRAIDTESIVEASHKELDGKNNE